MAIPKRLAVDFDVYQKDLVKDALSKMLSVFFDSCTLRQFVAVLVGQVQELYAAALEVEKKRSLYYAEGVNLEANGRIVGQDRALWQYSEDDWFKFDIAGQGWDQAPWYCRGADLGVYVDADDDTYRMAILTRIVKNHTLVASVPELCQLIKLMLNIDVSFVKCGPNKVNLVVSSGVDKGSLYILTHSTSDTRVDNTYLVPYPATMDFCDKVWFIPENPFFFDREEPFQWDTAEWAVGVKLDWS